ncbi:MAG: guanylate kinase [Bacteroidales bacterium]|nr:guanylate kinase [Bacteroidales bacterium]
MKLIILSAPSGAGKSTIIHALMKKDLKLEFSISACNRAPRAGEQNGVDYHFLSTEDFKQKIKNDEFVEWEEVYENHFYGTLKSELKRIESKGHHVIFDIDIAGGLNLKKLFGDRALALFIMPPSVQELERRLKSRATDSDENIQKRVAKATIELSYAKDFDYVIVNEVVENAVVSAEKEIRNFLNK